jgi:hypothetical protein
MSNLVYNERVKYAATFFNNLGVISLATGAVLPLFSPEAMTHNFKYWTMGVGLLLGMFFLFSAYRMLGELKE